MTVADLIAELQRMPQHLPVRLLMGSASQEFAEGNSVTIHLDESDALPVDTVRACGGYVLLRGE